MFSNRKFAALFALISAIVLVEFLQCASGHQKPAKNHGGTAVHTGTAQKPAGKKDGHTPSHANANKPKSGHPAAHTADKPSKKDKTNGKSSPKAKVEKGGKKAAKKAVKKEKQANQMEYMKKILKQLLTNHHVNGQLTPTIEETIIAEFHKHIKDEKDNKLKDLAASAAKVPDANLKKMINEEAKKGNKGKHGGDKPKQTAGHNTEHKTEVAKNHMKDKATNPKELKKDHHDDKKEKHSNGGGKGNNGNGSHHKGGSVPSNSKSGSRPSSPKSPNKGLSLKKSKNSLKEQMTVPEHHEDQNVSAQQNAEDYEQFVNSDDGIHLDHQIDETEPRVEQFDKAGEEQQKEPTFSDDDFPPLSRSPTRGNRNMGSFGGVEDDIEQRGEESAQPSVAAETIGDEEDDDETLKRSVDPVVSDEEKGDGGEEDEMKTPKGLETAEEEAIPSETNPLDDEDGDGGKNANADDGDEPSQKDEDANEKENPMEMDDDDGLGKKWAERKPDGV